MVVLDTHVLLWLTLASDRLGKDVLARIEEARSERQVYVSSITFWEVAMLVRKRRIEIMDTVEVLRSRVISNALQEIPVDGKIAIRSANLENFHNDPADRIITATALDGYKLVTADRRILAWQGPLHRINARD